MSDGSQGTGWWNEEPSPAWAAPARPSPRVPLAIGAVVVLLLAAAGVALLLASSSSDPYANGTPPGEGFVCGGVFLTWSTTNGHVSGTVWGAARKGVFDGTQQGSAVRFVSPFEGSDVLNGHLSGATLEITSGSDHIRCPLASSQNWKAVATQQIKVEQSAVMDRVAQSALTNAMVSAKALYVTTNGYQPTLALVTALGQQLPPFRFTAGPATRSGQISVAVSAGGQDVVMAVRSDSGRCWYAADVESPDARNAPSELSGTSYNASPAGVQVASCSAAHPGRLRGVWMTNYPS